MIEKISYYSNKFKKKLKTYLQKKSLCFLFSFLSLFTYKIVNSEQLKDLPYKRGSYLVCANGKAIPTSVWRNLVFYYPFDPLNPSFINGDWDYNTLNELYRLEKYHFGITAEVIVGKEPKRYSKDEQEAIMKRFMEGVRIPTSYKSTSVVERGRSWLYKFKNSENKELSIRKNNGFGLSVTDNNGNNFKGNVDDLDLVMFYCTNDYIVLRAVEKINFYRGQVTNEFNENIELPTIFWIREVRVKAEPPNMKKNYEF